MANRMLNIQLILSLIFSTFVFAETPKDKGLRISNKVDQFNQGFIGEQSSMEMLLIDAHGNKVTRILKSKVQEGVNDGDRSLSIFLKPLDVKGTKMLTWTHLKGDDDQWLFLPALKKVKRISSSNKSGSFLGSEFAYEDLGSQEVEKYSHKFLGEIKKFKNFGKVWKIERIPLIKSGYSRQVVYLSSHLMSAVFIEYFNRRNELMKEASFSDFKQFKLKGSKLVYRASKILMINKLTSKQTQLTWTSRKLNMHFKKSIFKKNSLSDDF